MPDWKPDHRLRDPALMRLLKLQADECELCAATTGLHLHHVLLRSRGGDDSRRNIVVLCSGCHDRYHRGDTAVRNRLAQHVARKRPDVADYLRAKLTDSGYGEWLTSHD